MTVHDRMVHFCDKSMKFDTIEADVILIILKTGGTTNLLQIATILNVAAKFIPRY